MMPYRTDLAVEALDRDEARAARRLRGFTRAEETVCGFPLTRLSIHTDEVAEALGKPRGTYLTLGLDALLRREEDAFSRACRAVSGLLGELLPPDGRGAVLAVGLGNRNITPDAVGPLAAGHILATRHLITHAPAHFRGWRPVSAVAPGVLGQTGVETGELLHGLLREVHPSAVIAIDALATGRLSALCRTIQLTDTGIVPGSGVGNARAALDQETLGVPVIAIGVPTVTDGATIAHQISEQAGVTGCAALDDLARPVLVTSRDIDREVADLSRVIGYAINLALHPGLTPEDIDLYLS